MSLNYNTNARLGNVKWGVDYKNVMMFESKTQQHNFFINQLTRSYNGLSVIQPNEYIDLDIPFDTAYNYNYCIYKDDTNNGGDWFFNFITNTEALNNTTTRFYITTDIWQQYHINCEYAARSFVIRSHVPTGEDIPGRWLATEPLSIPLTEQKYLGQLLNSDDWLPQWVLHATSEYDDATDSYDYSGTGAGATLTAERGYYISTTADIEKLIKQYGRKSIDDMLKEAKSSISWQDILNSFLSGGTSVSSYNALLTGSTSIAELQDHRNELVGIYAIPRWAKSGDRPEQTLTTLNDLTLPLTTNLAGNYIPKNKKMLTSVCGKKYVLYNRLGLSIELAPELINGNVLKISLSACPLGVQNYALHISNYEDLTKNYCIIGYNAQTRIGYDGNTGLDKTLNILSSSIKTISNVSKAIASNGVAGTANAAGNLINNATGTIDALGQQGVSIGNTGDIIGVTGGRPIPRIAVISPTDAECRYIDDFLSSYGYAINEILSVKKYMTCRTKFNYIQTQDIELSVMGNANAEQAYKAIFNSGVTIWHDYSVFGNTDVSNV